MRDIPAGTLQVCASLIEQDATVDQVSKSEAVHLRGSLALHTNDIARQVVVSKDLAKKVGLDAFATNCIS